jgi:hypothetical protein
MSDQRRNPRMAADWAARYRFEAGGAWRDCQVIDVSWDGAPVELHDLRDDERLAGPIDLEITSAIAADEGIPVGGVIRHGARTAMGRVLVGVEFESLTIEQHRRLQVLASFSADV